MRVRPEKKLEKEGRENLDFLCVFGKKKEANTIYYKWLFGKKKHTLFTVSSWLEGPPWGLGQQS